MCVIIGHLRCPWRGWYPFTLTPSRWRNFALWASLRRRSMRGYHCIAAAQLSGCHPAMRCYIVISQLLFGCHPAMRCYIVISQLLSGCHPAMRCHIAISQQLSSCHPAMRCHIAISQLLSSCHPEWWWNLHLDYAAYRLPASGSRPQASTMRSTKSL